MTTHIIQPHPDEAAPFVPTVDRALDWLHANPTYAAADPEDRNTADDCVNGFRDIGQCIVDVPIRCIIATDDDGVGDGNWTAGDSIANISWCAHTYPGLLRQLGIARIYSSNSTYGRPPEVLS